jgi:hypothetical protein
MFNATLKIKIWAYTHAVNCAEDWFVDPSCVGTQQQALDSKFKVAAVPVMFNRPTDFTYQLGNENIDLSCFDLVLLSDIEYRRIEDVTEWATQSGIKKWLLLTGGQDVNSVIDLDQCFYRPWWIYNRDLKFNSYQEVRDGGKPFVCDALLGSRRPNRDFVMLAMQQHGLLDQNIVTYREVFTGSAVNNVSQRVADYFTEQQLQYPYVSPNLDPTWEVSDNINHSVSQTVPWEIYRRTSVSLAVESVSTGSMFFMAEKISKPMMALRPFIVFGIKGYIKQLNQMSYKTFHPYIDESYDDIDDDIERWQAAFDQVVKLQSQDCQRLYIDLEDRLLHNLHWLRSFKDYANHHIVNLLRRHIDQQYWLN